MMEAGDAACGESFAVHNRGIQLILTFGIKNRAFARIEKRRIFEDFDSDLNGVDAGSPRIKLRIVLSRLITSKRSSTNSWRICSNSNVEQLSLSNSASKSVITLLMERPPKREMGQRILRPDLDRFSILRLRFAE